MFSSDILFCLSYDHIKWHIFCTQVTSDLFDIMSGQTDVDHPLCEECTDTLLDHLDTQLNITENECQNYK